MSENKEMLINNNVNLQNEGKNPSEAHIIKTIDGKLIGGLNYELSFFVKQIKPGTGGYIQQYVVEWWDEDQQAVKGTGFKQFSSKIGEWDEIVVDQFTIKKLYIIEDSNAIEFVLKYSLSPLSRKSAKASA